MRWTRRLLHCKWYKQVIFKPDAVFFFLWLFDVNLSPDLFSVSRPTNDYDFNEPIDDNVFSLGVNTFTFRRSFPLFPFFFLGTWLVHSEILYINEILFEKISNKYNYQKYNIINRTEIILLTSSGLLPPLAVYYSIVPWDQNDQPLILYIYQIYLCEKINQLIS